MIRKLLYRIIDITLHQSEANAIADHIDAQAAEIKRLRDALEWYQEKSKAMAGAAISGDRQAMLNLMQEIAVDYGKRARAALSGESNAS